MAISMPKLDIGAAAGKATVSTDAFAKALGKLKAGKEAAAAIDAVRKATGQLTVAEEKAARAAEKAARAEQKRAEQLAKKAARIAAREEERRATEAATQAADNAASSAAAEAAAIGALEAVAAAAVVAVTALAAGMAFLASKAIEVIQQRAGLLATFSAIAGGAAAGKATLAMVDKLSEKLPFVREQIDAWAVSLQTAGFRGKALETAIKAVAAAEAIRAGGGAAAEKMLKTLAEGGQGAQKMADTIAKGGAKSNKLLADMGLSSAEVTKALKEMGVKGKASVDQVGQAIEKALAAHGKDPLSEMGLKWEVIAAKAKEGFLSLFEGLTPAVKPFMAAVQSLFGQFNRGSPAMKALKPIVTEVFGTLFKYAALAVTWVSKLVAKMATGKNIGNTWHEVKAAISKVVSVLGTLWTLFKPVVTSTLFVKGLVTIVKVLAVAIGVAGAAMAATAGIMVALAGAVGTVGTFLWGLIGTIGDVASSIVDGLLNFDPSAFVAKMAAMASDGLAAFKRVLGINSPSAVMAEMGGYVAEGAQVGVDRGSGKAVASAGRMGADMAAGAGKGAAKGGGVGGKGGSLSIGEVHLHVADAGHPAAWAEEAFAAFMERLAATQGL